MWARTLLVFQPFVRAAEADLGETHMRRLYFYSTVGVTNHSSMKLQRMAAQCECMRITHMILLERLPHLATLVRLGFLAEMTRLLSVCNE